MKRILQVLMPILCTCAIFFTGCSGIENPSEKKGSISLNFSQTTNIPIVSGKSVNVDFTITGDVNGIIDVKCEAYNSWKAEVVKSSNTSGYIKVTSAGGDGKVTVVATCDGCTDTKELTFEGSVLSGVESAYEVTAEENTLTLNITTNIEYSIVIPSSVSWITNTTTKATHTDVVTLLIKKNEGAVRSASLSINSKDGSELFSFIITQTPSAISFKDYYAEKVCLAKFDNNKDGKLSYDEIKDITTIESKFFGDDAGNVKSFDELQYFTNVIKIDDMAFRHCEFLKSISFPANLKVIGREAFAGAKSLETLTLPESLEEIGEVAFNQCETLKEVVIPESVKIIRTSAFGTMNELEKLTIKGSPDVEGGIVSAAPKLYKLIGPDASSDGRYFISKDGMAYAYASLDQFAASVPIGVKSIGSALFWGCHNLTEITLPSTVTSIGIRSFASTNNLKKVSLSDAIQIIPESAFSGCFSLQEVKMPAELKKIEKLAFQYCKSMTGITIPYGCKGIGESAFEFCDKLKDIVLPGDIEEIGELCFRMCHSINSVVIPETIKSIGMGAFAGDTELSYVKMIGTIPPSLGQDAFAGISPSAKLSVPAGYSDAYQEWEKYFGGGLIMWGDVTLHLSIRGNETKASFDPYATPSINDDDVVWVNGYQYNAKNSCVTVTPAKDYSVVFTGKKNAAMKIDGSDLCYVNFPSPLIDEAIIPYCGFSSGTEIELKPIAGMMKIQLQKAKDISHIIVRTNSSNNFLSGYVGYDLSGSKGADYSFAANYVRVQNEGTDNCMCFSVPAQTFPAGFEIEVYDKSSKLVATKTSTQPITVGTGSIVSVSVTVGNDGGDVQNYPLVKKISYIYGSNNGSYSFKYDSYGRITDTDDFSFSYANFVNGNGTIEATLKSNNKKVTLNMENGLCTSAVWFNSSIDNYSYSSNHLIYWKETDWSYSWNGNVLNSELYYGYTSGGQPTFTYEYYDELNPFINQQLNVSRVFLDGNAMNVWFFLGFCGPETAKLPKKVTTTRKDGQTSYTTYSYGYTGDLLTTISETTSSGICTYTIEYFQ